MVDRCALGIHQTEPRSIPDLVREVAIGLDHQIVPLNVGTSGDRCKIDTSGIDAELIEHLDRVDPIIPGFGHRLTILAKNGAGNHNIFKSLFSSKLLGEHHHSRDPQEDNVTASYENIRRKECV